jgi:5-methylcytosine-specific restriction endonuclease McrA
MKALYYLDTFQVHKMTRQSARITLRKSLDRNLMMSTCLEEQKNKCFYCAVPITMADHLDHVVPLYYGGDNRPINLVAACKDCNLLKSTQQIEITNIRTIRKYKKMQQKHALLQKKIQEAYDNNDRDSYFKLVNSGAKGYRKYRADLFTIVCYN